VRFVRIPAFASALLVIAMSSAGAQCAPATHTLIARRDFHAAKRTLALQLRSSARNDSALHCLGILSMESGEQQEAVEFFEEAIAIAPRPVHRLALAMVLRAQSVKAGMFRAAPLMTRMKSELEAALGSDSTLIDAHYILLQFYAQVPSGLGGDMAKARGHATALLRLSPERGHVALGFIAEQEQNLAVAEREYRMATSIRPDSEPAYSAAGAFFRRQERWTDAIAMYERAARALPSRTFSSKVASVHYLLGDSLDKAGLRARAQTAYAAALKARPDHAESRKAFGGGSR
jgi:tetratricopeptide (TPR) repeat protein